MQLAASRGLSIATALVALGVVPASRAHACSGGYCASASVFPAAGAMPQNQLRWTFRPSRTFGELLDGGVSYPTLYRTHSDGAREAVPLQIDYVASNRSYALTPMATLEPGAELRLEAPAPTCVGGGALQATFQVSEAQPVPAALGTLALVFSEGLLTVATRAGSCRDKVEAAWADLALTRAEAVHAFADVIAYQLIVDGEPSAFLDSFIGATALPRGHERVYAPCQPNEDLIGAVNQGTHRAFMLGTLPHGEFIETPEVTFELRCEGMPAQPPDATGASADPDSGTAGAAQSGAADGGAAADVSEPLTEDSQAVVEEPASEAGCRAATGGAAHIPGWAWLGTSIWFATGRVRRRRAAESSAPRTRY